MPTDQPVIGVSSGRSAASYGPIMSMQLAKSAIDFGIVISDSDRSLSFYRDLLGLEHVADTPMPIGSGGTMHRLLAGESMVKLVSLADTPPAAAPGGIGGGLGFRYMTFQVSNLDEIAAACAAASVPVAIPVSEIRPGVRISIVEDPDGNWVEFVEAT